MTIEEQVKSVSEGLEFVKFGIAQDDDYQLLGDVIQKGKRPGDPAAVIVKPAEGWAFVPETAFDIVNYKVVQGPANQFQVVKQFPEQELKVTLSFKFSNSQHRQWADQIIADLKAMPGLVEVSEQAAPMP